MAVSVSVLMTSYNREKYIAEAIDSVLSQDYPDFELIIVDDCSVDSTPEIIKKYAKSDSRIKYFSNSLNIGQFANRNKAASLAEGEILMFVDSDDTIAPDALSYVAHLFEEFPLAGFVMIYYGSKLENKKLLTPQESINEHFFGDGILHVGPGGSAIRKDLFRRIHGFSHRFGPVSDMYYNLVVASSSLMLIHKNQYLNYRIHVGQELNNPFAYLHQGYRYIIEALDEKFMPLTDSQERFIRKKSKRRFLVNVIKHLRNTRSLMEVRSAIELARFGFKDFLEAIFSFSLFMIFYGGETLFSYL